MVAENEDDLVWVGCKLHKIQPLDINQNTHLQLVKLRCWLVVSASGTEHATAAAILGDGDVSDDLEKSCFDESTS